MEEKGENYEGRQRVIKGRGWRKKGKMMRGIKEWRERVRKGRGWNKKGEMMRGKRKGRERVRNGREKGTEDNDDDRGGKGENRMSDKEKGENVRG